MVEVNSTIGSPAILQSIDNACGQGRWRRQDSGDVQGSTITEKIEGARVFCHPCRMLYLCDAMSEVMMTHSPRIGP